MRQIKFRGKRKDNGEWVCGAYFNMHHNDEREHMHHFIIPDNTDISLGTPIEKIQVEVNPDTVGQFTGLRDKNGVEIYDGDIISLRDYVAEVRWNNNVSSFCIRFSFESELGIEPLGSWIGGRRGCRVIGNVFDNPELLK